MTELEKSLTALLMAELYEDEESEVEVLRDAIMAMLNDGEYQERDGNWNTFEPLRFRPSADYSPEELARVRAQFTNQVARIATGKQEEPR
jgi:hypothetical protein